MIKVPSPIATPCDTTIVLQVAIGLGNWKHLTPNLPSYDLQSQALPLFEHYDPLPVVVALICILLLFCGVLTFILFDINPHL